MKYNMENPNYYAIIPAHVRYSDITPNAKLLYGEITALSNKHGYCYATNSYFANLYNVSTVSISKWIKELATNNFITSEIKFKEGTKEILNRYIRIVNDPIKEKFNTPIKEKFKGNNTVINNTSNNNNIIKEVYQPAVDFWLKEFHQGWLFNATQGKKLNSILNKLSQAIVYGNKELSAPALLDAFKYLCYNLPDFFKDKELQVIDSKFNEILTQIKNKQNESTSKNNSRTSKFDPNV